MKKYLAICSFLLLLSCDKPIEPGDIAKLNGYWEIDYVILASGEKKAYSINETYDYFEIKGGHGTRTKVMPQLDGTFLTNGISEQLKIVNEKDQTFIDYKTPYAKWREQLVEVTDVALVLQNSEKKEYHYKKTGPINLNTDGKKTP